MLHHIGTQTIQTERLILRRFRPEDAPRVFDVWASDPEVSRYLRWTPHANADETAKVVAAWADSYENPRTYHWAICLPDGGAIGSIGIFMISDHDETADAGYCIGKAYWGNGYTTEALRAAIAYMFERVRLNRIETYHAVNNPASGKVMQKAGMVHEGHARQKYRGREGFEDSELYAIVREDWETQQDIARMMALPFVFDEFTELPELTDGVITLVCTAKVPADPVKKWVPAYDFDICRDGAPIGKINLRIGYPESLFYGGQIGYSVDEAERGKGYAVRACRLLAPVMRLHGMREALITNNVTNAASRRVCEKLGAQLLRVARIPEWHDLYDRGHTHSNIFSWRID